MPEKTFYDVGLRLNESEHLAKAEDKKPQKNPAHTSAGFFVMNTELIFAKCDAIVIWVFISSGDLSRTVSQQGTRSCFCSLIHVSTIDHISLHKTSVAICGYLKREMSMALRPIIQKYISITEYALEPTLFLTLYLPCRIPQQPLENVHPLEVVHEPRILGFAFLNEVVFVKNGLQNNILLIE